MGLRFSRESGADVLRILCVGVLSAWVLGGCGSTGQRPEPPRSVESLLDESSQALAGGLKEKSLGLLETAAKNNPTDARPWLKIAKAHFDNGNYPAAIVAADEAIKREPLNQEAKGISIVAALRVAVRSLGELRSAGGIEGETRSDAERLAKELRETLGEQVLVPPAAPVAEPASAPRKPVPKRRPQAAAPVVTPATAPAAAPAPAPARAPAAAPRPAAAKSESGSGGSNPFGSLK